MALTSGARIGPYEIVEAIGAGGMGEVYRARDTKLGREVAIKVLPDHLANDPDRIARFQREAQLLASLNHPHIAAIYGIEDGPKTAVGAGFSRPVALVLELVEGPTLADRVAAGPFNLDEALAIARQIAEALEAAHEKGVIHRDLKPGNVKVTPDGRVKVLDFGLAKMLQGETSSSSLSLSPTLSVQATMHGVILGTAAYMSPEQARGKPVDRRTDIWAFGCVLFEMLTGKQAFATGETISDVVAAILRSEPEWSALPAATPPAIRRLLRRCLTKDPRERLHDVADARLEILDAASGDHRDDPGATISVGASAAERRRGRERFAWGAAALAIVAAIAIGAIALRPPPDRPALRTDLVLPVALDGDPGGRLALSPDGTRLAFTATLNGRRILWVRSLDNLSAQPLSGTDNASYPFWSPDGRALGFVADGKLKRIDVTGGSPLTLADSTGQSPGTWNQDGIILFSPLPRSAIYRIAASGGTPAPVTVLDPKGGEVRHANPVFLPDGRRFLYIADAGRSANPSRVVWAGSLDSPDRVKVLDSGSNVAYASGFFFFLRDATLMAQRFDLDELKMIGDPAPVAEQVSLTPGRTGSFTVSHDVLVYQRGVIGGPLIWLDRSGSRLDALGRDDLYQTPQISPDGTAVLVTASPEMTGSRDVWLLDTRRGARTRMTIDAANDEQAIWSPDGSRFVFSSNRRGVYDLYLKEVAGSGAEELLFADEVNKFAASWSRDGVIAYATIGAKTGSDIWMLPMSGDRKPVPFLRSPFNETQPTFSPDGRWVAYGSDESGTPEIHVTAYPGPKGKWPVSTSGGQYPRWSGNGREIFYRSVRPTSSLTAVSITADPTRLEIGAPSPLFYVSPAGRFRFDVTADAQRFLVNVTQDFGGAPLTVVTNWPALLKE